MPSGRLTLNWVGKDQALLTTRDGGYEWVDRTDPRVTEIRLLHGRETVGAVGPDEKRAADNLLIHGDAADGLRTLLNLPEYAPEYRGKVKLVYIDPPFNTNQTFLHYDDSLEHSVWLTMMRDRLTLIRDLLAPDGSVWVHLDDAEMSYCKVVLDELFGRANFVATVIWQKVYSPKNSARHLSVDQDYILVYARNADAWCPRSLTRTADMDAAYQNPDNDKRGPWKPGDLVANKPYSLGRYPITTPSGRSVAGPPPGRFWRISADRLAELDADDRIWWGEAEANIPALKRFLTEVRGRVPQTLWLYSEVGHSQTGKNEIQALFPGKEPFATPKPERLLQRIIAIASGPGDIVLDCFGGSGTSAAVAHKMGRRWVTVEREKSTVDDFMRPRLEMVVSNDDPGGITSERVDQSDPDLPTGVVPGQARKAASALRALFDAGLLSGARSLTEQIIGETVRALRSSDKSKKVVVRRWHGGGGFRVLDVGPSMYDVADGRVLLAEWTANGQFAAAACAQLGFTVDDDPPFAGRRGRVRLAAVDGVADESVVRALVSNLDENERLVIVAKASAPGAESLLRELSSGSRILKAPRDLVGVTRLVCR